MRISFFAIFFSVVCSSGCLTTALGRGPVDRDLENDGGTEAQLELYRQYEIVYDQTTFKRKGAAPDAIATEAGVARVDAVQAQAWSDDAFNYLSSSRRAADVMEEPAVAFDGFAHSGMGETVLMGLGVGGGLLTGAVAWFVGTTIRDGVTEDEWANLTITSGTGLLLGGSLGFILAAAYTYIVPNVSTPFAVPLYRKAARAFNEDLEDGILRNSPQGDAPPVEEPDDGNDDDAGNDDAGDDDAGNDDDVEAPSDDAPPEAKS